MTTYVFPGQGSQQLGMGENLFDLFPDLTARADAVLGYSIKNLCLQDPQQQLNQTQYTQPALYVVNTLHYFKRLRETGHLPHYLAGHSLGEYNALLAAGVFDFETGLKLVCKRGELMSQATDGSMAAVIGLKVDEIQTLLQQHQLTGITIANYNSPTQTILSGSKTDIAHAQPIIEKSGLFKLLNVSGAFHSPLMLGAQLQFASFLQQFTFSTPKIPVIANISARPYQSTDIQTNLAQQITNSVQWLKSIEYLLQQGETEFVEIGPGTVLTSLIKRIKADQASLTTLSN